MNLDELKFNDKWNSDCEQSDLELYVRYVMGERIEDARERRDDGAVYIRRLTDRMDQRVASRSLITVDNLAFLLRRTRKRGIERRIKAEAEGRWPFCLIASTPVKIYAILFLAMARCWLGMGVRVGSLSPVLAYLG
jgi:hypothetical protein